MFFEFAPTIQAGIDSGIYEIVRNEATGQLIGIARDKVTGKFVAHAIGVARDELTSQMFNNVIGASSKATGIVTVNPIFAPAQIALGGLQMAQTHLGFQKTYKMLDNLQKSVEVLQGTTAFIGVGVISVGFLSAVNLYQIMKLREDVKQLRLEVKEGFIDLKQALKEESTEIKKLIDIVANDVGFKQHRVIIIQAYGLFVQALECLRIAMQLQGDTHINSQVDAARGMLFQALAHYNNPHLLSETCAAGQLRRLECAWAIEQAIVTTFQIQNQFAVVSDCLARLQEKIRQDCIKIIQKCESAEELDFLFPEIVCIQNNDLFVLESWQNHVEWFKELSSNERKSLAALTVNSVSDEITSSLNIIEKPKELLFYEELKNKSHYLALREQLLFMIKPSLRSNYENYIAEQAINSGYKGLTPSRWQEVPDLTVANLYWYFKSKDKRLN